MVVCSSVNNDISKTAGLFKWKFCIYATTPTTSIISNSGVTLLCTLFLRSSVNQYVTLWEDYVLSAAIEDYDS